MNQTTIERLVYSIRALDRVLDRLEAGTGKTGITQLQEIRLKDLYRQENELREDLLAGLGGDEKRMEQVLREPSNV